MPDIFHDLTIRAPAKQVFDAVSTPRGLDAWWTKRCSGHPAVRSEYELWFGPEFDWRGVVSRCVPHAEFELEIGSADRDWLGTRVGFALTGRDGVTEMRFHHTGWPLDNDHYRVSRGCWGAYLRLLKRYVEAGETVLYEDRLTCASD